MPQPAARLVDARALPGLTAPRIVGAIAALALAASCAPAPSAQPIGVRLPERLAALSAEDAASIVATLEITGLLAESPLTISADLAEASGTFTVAADAAVSAPFVVRVKFQPDDDVSVLLARLDGTVDIAPARDNALEPAGDYDTCGAAAAGAPCSLLFDLNRNGQSNLDDLVEDIDPLPPPPFVDVAPSDLTFPSGIRLGSFSRQVIVVENTSLEPVDFTVTLIDAPGATLSLFETEVDPNAAAQRTLSIPQLGSFQEALVAVSFAPVNAFLTVGDVFVEATLASNVKQATRVRLLANVDGELQPPALDFETRDLAPGAALGGYEGAVEKFPTTSLFNGLPVTTTNSGGGSVSGLPFAGGAVGASFLEGGATIDTSVPADHAFLLDIPADHKLSVSLSQLQSDVDLAVFLLDDGDVLSSDPARNFRVGKSGTSEEAVEHTNESGAVERALVVLGRVDLEVPEPIVGGLALSVPAPFQLSCHVTSTPEFTAPIGPAGGPLEGGTRVTLRGRRFHPNAQVTFADVRALDCTFATEGLEGVFSCTTPPGSLQVGKNPATIVVANPGRDDGGDGQAATLPEGYTYEPPAPRLDSLLPPVATTAGGGTVRLQGAFFSQRNGAPVVFFDGAPLDEASVSFRDSTTVEVIAPGHGAGVVAVWVQNVLDRQPDDPADFVRLSLPSNVRNFTYVAPDQPAPTVTEVAPTTGSIDGELVTITGADFQDDALVLFDGAEASDAEVISATAITCRAPARDTPGVVDIEVITSTASARRWRTRTRTSCRSRRSTAPSRTPRRSRAAPSSSSPAPASAPAPASSSTARPAPSRR